MNPTKVMREEHGGIQLMLRILESILEEARKGKEPDFEAFEQVIEFFQVFADRCHHGKEEDLLFPALKGVEEAANIISGLISDHERGREYVSAMVSSLKELRSGNESAMDRLATATYLYINLLREHIRREDEELWPIADRVLEKKAGEDMTQAFERVELEKIGAGTHEKFHHLMHGLRDRHLLPRKTDIEAEREYLDGRFNPKTIFESLNGKFIVAYFRQGQFIPIHSPSVDLVLFIVEGSGEVAAGNERYRVTKGDVVTVPAHVKRGVRAETEMTIIHVVTPPPTEADHREVKGGFKRGTWE